MGGLWGRQRYGACTAAAAATFLSTLPPEARTPTPEKPTAPAPSTEAANRGTQGMACFPAEVLVWTAAFRTNLSRVTCVSAPAAPPSALCAAPSVPATARALAPSGRVALRPRLGGSAWAPPPTPPPRAGKGVCKPTVKGISPPIAPRAFVVPAFLCPKNRMNLILTRVRSTFLHGAALEAAGPFRAVPRLPVPVVGARTVARAAALGAVGQDAVLLRVPDALLAVVELGVSGRPPVVRPPRQAAVAARLAPRADVADVARQRLGVRGAAFAARTRVAGPVPTAAGRGPLGPVRAGVARPWRRHMGLTDVGGGRSEAIRRPSALPVAVAGTALTASGLAGVRVGSVAFDVSLRDGVAVLPGAAALGCPPVVVATEAGRCVRVGAVLIPSTTRRAAATEGVPTVRGAATGGPDDPLPATIERLGPATTGRLSAQGARVTPPLATRGPPLVGLTHYEVDNRSCWAYCSWTAGGRTEFAPSSAPIATRRSRTATTTTRTSDW